jgi:hypothetical protein
LYWASAPGEKRSPLGDLVAEAALDRRARTPNRAATPLYGYYFRILTTQGPAASGGAMDYIVGGEMLRGFALIAWPANYDVTGVMTFMVNQGGIVYQRDLGRDTDAVVRKMMLYDPDGSWQPVVDD